MIPFARLFGRRPLSSPWADTAPVRDELFGVERLEQHAQSLAAAQDVTATPPDVVGLHVRLNDNARVLLEAYRASAAELERGHEVVPAAEWLLDNYHVIEEQVREIRDDLPPGYYRQLPKLARGPLAGYPRVFGLAWAFVAHTDSHFEPATLRRFIDAYQRVQPLTIGELWAVAITLRIVLVENLRRLADQISAGRVARADADRLARRLLASGQAHTALQADIASRPAGPLSELFAAQLAQRLRDQDPSTTPALGWLGTRLAAQGTSVDRVVHHAQQRQGASNVTVRNIITSMRLMSDIDWADLFESVSLVDARLGEASGFAAMDFTTRNLYRSAIEQLARGSALTELDVAAHALAAAQAAAQAPASDSAAGGSRTGEPGYYLIAEGRPALERDIGFKPPARLWVDRLHTRMGLAGYAASIVGTSAALLWLALQALPGGPPTWPDAGLALWLLALWLPATEVATALVNRWIAWRCAATPLPALEIASGVPTPLRTLVAVPTLMSTTADLLEQIERLEVHYLASGGGDVSFALLVDGLDAPHERMPADDALVATGLAAVAALNLRHGPAPGGSRFLLLRRRRLFNPAEQRWMGWERKRGKLHELNRLLRGAADTSFEPADDGLQLPPDVVYVITLDADTQLPRDTVRRLVGKMAHPLNQPRFSQALKRVTGGHAVLQPRVTPSLPLSGDTSLYQRISSSPGGLDPYASTASDVYQDLFGEGSYTGKGIYHVDSFEAALAARVDDNTLLSHDLFEGVFARAGLASDVDLIEEAVARYDVASRRQHRWTRGDWQLLPWLLAGRGGRHGGVPAVGRWKMLDNLRRSLIAPSALLALAASWLLPEPVAVWATLAVLVFIATPPLLSPLLEAGRRRPGVPWRGHARRALAELRLGALRALLAPVFLADQAWQMADAIVRTLIRLAITRRHLLEWTTAAQSASGPRPTLAGSYRQMAGGTVAGVALAITAAVFSASPGWLAALLPLPFALAWLAAPALALRASRPLAAPRGQAPRPGDSRALRLIARRTWRYFETFVTADDHMLPPDNFQEEPRPALARRTSPTNIGLYLLSAVSARDFGWAGTLDTVERLEATLATMAALPRFKGHLYNWYDTGDLRALDPPYVSSVDSGNLAGHLIALANACEEWREPSTTTPGPDARTGMRDSLQLALESLEPLPAAHGEQGVRIAQLLEEIGQLLHGPLDVQTLAPALARQADKAAAAARALAPPGDADTAELAWWIEAIGHTALSHARDARDTTPAQLAARLQAIADTARASALEMDFAFLLEPERKLLSIGYSVVAQSLDTNCYDLLASEARLASLFAIAKGDVPTRHWFRLGRTATPVGQGSALISWSGSMFEYLMPDLVMRAPSGSLLEQTSRLAVERQVDYADQLGVPWGISESSYNARDLEFTYQYSNFGVPGLGLKRGLAENLVIAPYATGLAAMVDARLARQNYTRLAQIGALGRHGFYEAIDFTASRVPEGASSAVVRSYMAHHQGMTIVAIANTLQGGRMRARFHREPLIQSAELLLQERVPRDVIPAHPRAEEVRVAAHEAGAGLPTVRRLDGQAHQAPPVTQLLSNSRYAIMLTAAGAGYSRWNGMAVTRWREDATRDPYGAFVYLRDAQGGAPWSPTAHPLEGGEGVCDVVFGEDHATFTRHAGSLTTTMDVLVSGEDDGEVRRVSVSNSGRRARDIDITSYAEVVLAAQGADDAHQAFSKLFVITEHLAEFGALIATRRPRTPDEPALWAGHFAVVEGELMAAPQHTSSRAGFLGRGRDARDPQALDAGASLDGATGTVLDAVFSLRRRVRVPAGGLARVSFWTIVAPSRAALLDLIDRHHDRNAFARAKTLAWTQAQVQLHHLATHADEAGDFQRLAAPLLYADPRFRAPQAALLRGAAPQSGLWPYAISGDLPIVLLRIAEVSDLAQVRQLLRAHEYWRLKQLAVDLVIVNERGTSYTQELQDAIDTAVRSSQSRPRAVTGFDRGSVHVLRAELMNASARELLQACARVVLDSGRGPLREQLERLLAAPRQTARPPLRTLPAAPHASPATAIVTVPAQPDATRPALEFFNGLGGFDNDGREYVVRLQAGQTTPAPWINVISNPGFGFQVSADGSGYTWAENSRENQLTPWSNDAVIDPAGEAIYVRDEVDGQVWTATAQPMRDDGLYEARHGHGYSRFCHEAHGIALELLQYVPLGDAVKLSRLTLHNRSNRRRRLSVTSYAEWVLGTARGANAPFIVTTRDAATGALLASRPWTVAFPGRVAFADLGGRQSAWTADRTEFLGRGGGAGAPAALLDGVVLSGATGAGLDPCAALQCSIELAPGESVEVVALLGHAASAEQAGELVARYRAMGSSGLDGVLAEVTAHWRTVLGSVQVKTPDRAMDVMLNGWLLYQTLACRLWARSAFYQASGAYGFRDQLQDGMALTLARPADTRAHLLRAAGRQFREGDVQHWWLPHSGQGVRTRISDDRVWLAYAAATYVASAGDAAVLDESAPFLDGPPLRDGEHDAFFQPLAAPESATLYEHCARGLDQCLVLHSARGLPLIGTGDWNDGMNRVGEGGQGESVWLGWLLLKTLALFTPYARQRNDARAERWEAHATALAAVLERDAWDGAWYRRATFDDGSWLGAQDSGECQIDSIAQSWAVLSGAAQPERAATAMASLQTHLVRPDAGIAPLFWPPFDHTPRDPGYIKGYPPGLRENGGQYSHAAMWAVMAFARLGQGDEATALWSMLNPVQHARTPAEVARYKVEPYVVAADVYSVAPHEGRGGWTWYTGSAAWMYRAGIESILGIRREGGFLVIDPCLPASWPGYEATITLDGCVCDIHVRNVAGRGCSVTDAVFDGQAWPTSPTTGVRIPLHAGHHTLALTL